MNIRLQYGLPFVTVTLRFRGQSLVFNNVLLDTGSASTIFPIEKVLTIGIYPESDDLIHRIRGVGGTEFVFSKRVDQLELNGLIVSNFEIEVGAMAYGFELDGIIGMDFLLATSAHIDLANLNISAIGPNQ